MATTLEKALTLVRSALPREHQLSSSALRSVSYDRSRRIMRVTFTSGSKYEFGSVEPWRFRHLLAASSAGRYFVNNIRNNYPYRCLSADTKRTTSMR